MSAYKELVERCVKAAFGDASAAGGHAEVEAVLAEVLRTLETVTPEMDIAGDSLDWGYDSGDASPLTCWPLMLHASPLAPTK